MFPEVIIHNTLSLDNAFYGFDIDLEAHYSILTSLAPDAVLVGSDTAKTGVEMFYNPIPAETKSDLKRPEKVPGDTRPVSVIVDSRGKLKGLLHIYRNLEHVRDVIVLVSETTPADYLKYLEEREYPYLMSGYDRVDLKEAVGLLGDTFGFSRIVSDSGGRLNCILIDERIASSLSIIIAPLIAGPDHRRYFEDIDSTADLRLKKTENLKNGLVHLVYDIMK
ncbi:5-amino-6-(5-phosphoribosylamino)uracilreductase [Methanolacinia petrolearia DSM 11571]|uniref:5-amino-6-(5-phosphoribosylamino)uracilreductase n=1 Tax=Methanolacinia petrolearia (strain DSM 11571 / OCM 486 / SEBR 4847) TaxID=679926 RepID=E1REI4_METP4|nr:dihydrofolate reductase family protein [Methanolacinia petrolearia]ADN37227.1 5-amino-6-(5-phosphoribosylamino)uracilreductase [Methanolacinia petrolearia DSM 11571]